MGVYLIRAREVGVTQQLTSMNMIKYVTYVVCMLCVGFSCMHVCLHVCGVCVYMCVCVGVRVCSSSVLKLA